MLKSATFCVFLRSKMEKTLDSSYIYSEIVTHTTLDLMTKLTEYKSQDKLEAKIEALRSNAESRVLKKNSNFCN